VWYDLSVPKDTIHKKEGFIVDVNLFEYAMKNAGFKTAEQRAAALGISLSAYYRRTSKKSECSIKEIATIANLLGWDMAREIFFTEKVS
jgi:hypothetical protein